MPKNLVDRELLERRIAARVHLSDSTHPGVGNFCPGSVLLIGEQSARPKTSTNQWPFCDVRACSGWLNSQLELARIPEERLYWVNALNNDGTKLALAPLVDNLYPSAIIALGKVAEQLCKSAKSRSLEFTKFITVPHPQYWKRFKHHEPYQLIWELKNMQARKVEVKDAGHGRLSLWVNGYLGRTAETMSQLLRVDQTIARYKLPLGIRLAVRDWLKLDLGLTDPELWKVEYFDDKIPDMPFVVR